MEQALNSPTGYVGKRAEEYAGAITNFYHRNRIYIAVRLLKRARPLQGLRVFDFGCGEGVLMRQLSALGAKVDGCDPSAALIALAPYPAKVGGVELLESQQPGSCDALVALHVLSYMDEAEQQRFWLEASRIVIPGGLILFTNSNVPSERHKAYTPTDSNMLPDFLRRHGFEETDRDYIGYWPLILRWNLFYRLLRLNKIGEFFGYKPTGRAARVYNNRRLILIPRFLRQKRSVGYYSISRRIT